MHCGRVSNLLSAYLDRELAGAEMLQIRRHLDLCPGCTAERDALVRVKSLLSGAPPAEPSGDLVAAIMQRYAERHSQPLPAPRGSWKTHWKWTWLLPPSPRRHRWGLSLTAACLVLAIAGTGLALRKPNYPDAVATNIWPLIWQPEERPHYPHAVTVGYWPSVPSPEEYRHGRTFPDDPRLWIRQEAPREWLPAPDPPTMDVEFVSHRPFRGLGR